MRHDRDYGCFRLIRALAERCAATSQWGEGYSLLVAGLCDAEEGAKGGGPSAGHLLGLYRLAVNDFTARHDLSLADDGELCRRAAGLRQLAQEARAEAGRVRQRAGRLLSRSAALLTKSQELHHRAGWSTL